MPSPSQSAGASCATSPARGRGSPLRHSPLARPVPPPPHAWEVNVTYRSGLPRLRDCEAEARPADETAEAERGQRSAFCKPAATGAAKTGDRNRGPQVRRGPRLRDCAAKTGHRNRGPQGRRGPKRSRAASLIGPLSHKTFTNDQNLETQHRFILEKFLFSSTFCRFWLDKGNSVVLNYAQGTGMVTCSPNVLVRVTNNNKEEISK